jgi:hypothetical protein
LAEVICFLNFLYCLLRNILSVTGLPMILPPVHLTIFSNDVGCKGLLKGLDNRVFSKTSVERTHFAFPRNSFFQEKRNKWIQYLVVYKSFPYHLKLLMYKGIKLDDFFLFQIVYQPLYEIKHWQQLAVFEMSRKIIVFNFNLSKNMSCYIHCLEKNNFRHFFNENLGFFFFYPVLFNNWQSE